MLLSALHAEVCVTTSEAVIERLLREFDISFAFVAENTFISTGWVIVDHLHWMHFDAVRGHLSHWLLHHWLLHHRLTIARLHHHLLLWHSIARLLHHHWLLHHGLAIARLHHLLLHSITRLLHHRLTIPRLHHHLLLRHIISTSIWIYQSS